jgi:hypothetical protein
MLKQLTGGGNAGGQRKHVLMLLREMRFIDYAGAST